MSGSVTTETNSFLTLVIGGERVADPGGEDSKGGGGMFKTRALKRLPVVRATR